MQRVCSLGSILISPDVPRYGPNGNAARKMLVLSGFPRKQSRVPPPVGRINFLVSALERMSHFYFQLRTLITPR